MPSSARSTRLASLADTQRARAQARAQALPHAGPVSAACKRRRYGFSLCASGALPAFDSDDDERRGEHKGESKGGKEAADQHERVHAADWHAYHDKDDVSSSPPEFACIICVWGSQEPAPGDGKRAS